MEQPSQKSAIVIIGAGIIGLATAARLVDTLDRSKFEVILVSREWPTSIPGVPIKHSVDYASMWAGAHVRPIPASTPQLKREAAWLKHTVGVFEEQLRSTPWIGVTKCKGIELLEAPPAEYEQQTSKSFLDETGLGSYRKYDQSELPNEVKLGYEYETYCVNAPVYCANLLRQFILKGGNCVQGDLASERDGYSVAPNVELVINASGTGFGDAKCFPTRGQTVLTNFTAAKDTVTRQLKDGSWSFIIPRFFGGGTVIGGTKQPRDWNAEPEQSTRDKLLEEGRKIAGLASNGEVDTGSIGVIADIVGRRPTREGGMRTEVEQVPLDGGQEGRVRSVVHAYGAGGRGYEISWGVAEEVVQLVTATLARQESDIRAKL